MIKRFLCWIGIHRWEYWEWPADGVAHCVRCGAVGYVETQQEGA